MNYREDLGNIDDVERFLMKLPKSKNSNKQTLDSYIGDLYNKVELTNKLDDCYLYPKNNKLLAMLNNHEYLDKLMLLNLTKLQNYNVK